MVTRKNKKRKITNILYLITLFLVLLVLTTPIVYSLDLSNYESPYGTTGAAAQGLFGQSKSTADLGEQIVINVADMQSVPVRQSLLEQQNVPIFVYLKGSTVGSLFSVLTDDPEMRDPFSGVSNTPIIKYITITEINSSKQFLSGTPRYVPPAKRDFSLSNMGYLIVNLRKITNITKLPSRSNTLNLPFTNFKLMDLTDKVIDVNLKADIYFDLQKGSLFGITEQQRVLDPVPVETDFVNKIKSDQSPYSILGGRAFIRATDISSNSITLMLYDKSHSLMSIFSPLTGTNSAGINTLSSLRLIPNEVSGVYSLGYTGDPFSDNFRIRLDQITTPQNNVQLVVTVNDKTTRKILRIGEKIYQGSTWTLKQIDPLTIKSNPTREELADMNFDDSEIKAPIEQLRIETHSILIENTITRENRRLYSKVLKSGTDIVESKKLADSQASFLENEYCPILLNPQQTITLAEDAACKAVVIYKDLIARYPDSKESTDTYLSLADIYNENLIQPQTCNIKLSSYNTDICKKYKKDMRNLAVYYWTKVIDKNPLKADELRQKMIEASTINSEPQNFIEDEYNIGLELVTTTIISEKEKASATIRLGDYEKEYTIGENLLKSSNTNDYFKTYAPDNTELTYYVYSIDSNRVVLMPIKRGSNVVPNVFSSIQGSETLLLNQLNNVPYYPSPRPNQQTPTNPSLMPALVTKITTRNQAYITILPAFDSAKVSTNFTVHIPIEQRPFTLTPDALRNQINATQALLAKMDAAITKLDSVVSTWKRVCIVTFGVLIVKNSFLSGTARNMARKAVNPFFKKQCTQEVAEGKSSSMIACYDKKATEIEAATDANQRAIVYTQEKMKDPATLDTDDYKKYVTQGGGSIDQYRESLRLGALKKDNGYNALIKNNPNYGEYVNQQFDTVDIQARIKLVKDAEKFATDNACRGKAEPQKANCIQTFTKQYLVEKQSQSAKSISSLIPNSQALSSLVPVLTDDKNSNTYTSVVTNPDTKTPQPVELVHVTQLQYEIYKAGSIEAFVENLRAEVMKEIDVNNVNVIDKMKQEIIRMDFPYSDSNRNQLYVEKEYLTTTPVIISLCENQNSEKDVKDVIFCKTPSPHDDCLSGSILGKVCSDKNQNLQYPLLIFNDRLAAKPITNEGEIHFYTAPTATMGDKTLNTQFNSNDKKIVAQFDDNGRPYCYPVKLTDPRYNQANYVQVLNWFANGDPDVVRLMNVGPNGQIECGAGDDVLILGQDSLAIPEFRVIKSQLAAAVAGKRCAKDGELVQGAPKVDNLPVVCSKNSFLTNKIANSVECIDTMDPSDCTILFNTCDPVMCPTSRCNLGGAYTPPNGVIASGMIGSLILCTPNFPTVKVPICLTGVLSGLRNYRSVVAGYQECLEANLKDGKNVGFCDYMNSVGICEILWRETTSLLDIKGGVLNYIGEKLFDSPKGGGEYLLFNDALNNVGASVQAFTKEYSETKIAAIYQGKSSEEFGSQVCRKSVNSKFPTIGTILDQLAEPEDPPQFTAWFDSVPYASPGRVAGTLGAVANSQATSLDQYTIFYHIYAGSGSSEAATLVGNQPIVQAQENSLFSSTPSKPGVRYSVILRGGDTGQILYVTENPSESGQRDGVIQAGGFVQKTVNAIASSGLSEICVIINGKTHCGFKRITTDFGMSEAEDRFVEGQSALTRNITNAGDCTTGISTAKDKIGNTVSPIDSGLFSSSVKRLCAPQAPTAETDRWTEVGSCGKDVNGLDLGKCWLDKQSVHINDKNYEAEVLKQLTMPKLDAEGKLYETFLSSYESISVLALLKEARDALLKQIESAYGYMNSGTAVSQITPEEAEAPPTPAVPIGNVCASNYLGHICITQDSLTVVQSANCLTGKKCNSGRDYCCGAGNNYYCCPQVTAPEELATDVYVQNVNLFGILQSTLLFNKKSSDSDYLLYASDSITIDCDILAKTAPICLDEVKPSEKFLAQIVVYVNKMSKSVDYFEMYKKGQLFMTKKLAYGEASKYDIDIEKIYNKFIQYATAPK